MFDLFIALWRKKSNRRLLSNIFSMSLLQGADYVLPLILLPFLIRTLGLAGYGMVNLSIIVNQLFVVVLDFGFSYASSKKVALAIEDTQKTAEHFWNTFLIKTVLLLGIIVLIFLLFLSGYPYSQHILLGFGITLGQYLFPMWFFQGKQEFGSLVGFSLVMKILIAVLLVMKVRSATDVNLVLAIYSFCYLLAGIVAFTFVLKTYKLHFTSAGFSRLYDEVKEGFGYFASLLLSRLYSTLGVVLLGQIAPIDIVGSYSVAEKIITAAKRVIQPVAQVLYPHVSVLFAHNKKQAHQFFEKSLRILLLCSGAAGVALFLAAPYVVRIVTGEYNSEITFLIRILSLLPAMVSVSNSVAIQYLFPQNLIRPILVIQMLAVIVYAGIFFPLVSILGATGAALAWLISEFIIVVLFYLKYKGVQYDS